MNLPARLLPVALVVVVSLLPAGDVRDSDRTLHEVDADKPGEAMAFRSLSLRDDAGQIAGDGLMRARMQADSMRARLNAIEARSIPLTRAGWTWIGPGNIGGRVRALVVHPTSTNTMFAGSVSGGIWKTTNGGASWAPVDDFMANLAVTSLVFNPTNPQVMYAATGEGFSNADSIRGAGIFKSIDGGTTWTQLSSTTSSSFHYVLRLAISRDGRTLLAGAQSGLFRSTNAGSTWTLTATGPAAFDVDFHPTDSRRAIAGDATGHAWLTTDAGLTWNSAQLTLPSSGTGSYRVEVAYAPGSPNIVYAVIDCDDGLVYRSIDGGATYVQVYSRNEGPPILENGQGWYDLALWANPIDANDLLVGGVNVYRSRDGGQSFTQISTAFGGLHPDQHIIVAHPRFNNSSNRVVFIGNDGGVFKAPDLSTLTSTSNADFVSLNNTLGITQFYGAAGNPATGVIVGGTQDNGTLVFNPASGSEGWETMFGGDGGYSAADPSDPNYLYGEYVYLQLHRSANGGRSSSFIYMGLSDAGRRANFIAPFILDPNAPRRLLAGGQSLWRTNDIKAATPTWRSIKTGSSDNYISAIAVAPGNSNIIWVGHNNGDLYRTTNGTATTPAWTKVDPSGFPNRFLTRITIDPLDPSVVYVAFGGFADRNIQRTINGGSTWTDATGSGTTGLPLAPVRDVEIDPDDSAVLWAGTEVGIFTSRDRGRTWDATHDGPANVSVDELFVLGSHLYAVTHGRGLFRHALEAQAGIPAASISPASSAFPSTYVGSASGPSTITLVNAGTAPLLPTQVEVDGTNASDFVIGSDACTGETVAPAAFCTVDVRFRPTAPGRRSALVVMTTNAADSPHAVEVWGDALAAPQASIVPLPWSTLDVGAVGVTGAATYSNGSFSVRGAGADVWGTADAFRFVYQTLNGDGEIAARVASVQDTAEWVKAGVMIRQSTSPSSAHGFMIVSAGKGLAFQRRSAAGGPSTHTAGGTGAAPQWVKLTRRGQTITASRSSNGSTWTVVGSDTVALTGPVLIGLAVSSHTTARSATASFDHVTIAGATPALPTGWSARDVGTTGVAGSTTMSGATLTLRGAGADIWGTADAFHMAYRTLNGNGTIIARVGSITGTEAWTKVGVMMRGSTSAGSAHAAMLVSSAKGLAFQRRTASGSISTHTSGGTGGAPRWVRLVRAGNLVTASTSINGTTWTVVGSDTIALPTSILVGLFVSSHDPALLARATFDNVVVGQ